MNTLKHTGSILLTVLLCVTTSVLAAPNPECGEHAPLAKLIANPDAYHGKALWVVAYVLLSGSIAPAWILARLVGLNGWQLYMQGAFYLYGEILLMALLLKEYVGLASARPERRTMTVGTA